MLEAIQDNDSGHLSEILGPEVLRRMAEQTRLEELYHGSTITSDEAAVASLDVDDLQEIVEQLERNTRELCRKLREVPNVVQELRGLQEVKPVNSMKFIHALADMQVSRNCETECRRMHNCRSDLHYIAATLMCS